MSKKIYGNPVATPFNPNKFTGGGGGGAETDPTVPEWAKHPTKPTYTAQEVGARPAAWLPSASEIGARPNTWTPTASEVGARPDTWLPSASEIGARPNTWTPTASEVGARPDTWLPTIGEIGAAPAGYGLGESEARFAADLNTAIKPGWYFTAYNTINCPRFADGSDLWNYSSVFVEVRYSTVVQWLYSNPCLGVRTSTDGGASWDDVECVNPPMTSGVEYRTTERSQGSPVCAKRVQYTSESVISGQMKLNIPHGITNFGRIVRVNGQCGIYTVPHLTQNGGFLAFEEVNASDIVMSNYNTYWGAPAYFSFDLYYVKA